MIGCHTTTRAHHSSGTSGGANEIDGNSGDPVTATTGDNWIDPVYDDAGNMTRGPRPGDEDDQDGAEQRYTYDAWNRMVKVERREYDEGTPGSWSDLVFHTYDGLNRRNSTIDLTGGFGNWVYHYHFFSSSWQEIEERKGGDVNRQFVWGLRYIDDLILRDRDADEDDQTGELGTPGTTSGLEERLYALQDANWNTVALAETDGDIAERFRYTAYGEPIVLNGAADADGGGVNDFSADADNTSDWDWEVLYAGYHYNALTRTYLVRNRVYGNGRWHQWDMKGYVDGMNVYQYVRSQPTNLLDPMGTKSYVRWVGADAIGVGVGNWTFGFTSPLWVGAAFNFGFDVVYHCNNDEVGVFVFGGFGVTFGSPGPIVSSSHGLFVVYGMNKVADYQGPFRNVSMSIAAPGIGGFGEVFWTPDGKTFGFGAGFSITTPGVTSFGQSQKFWILASKKLPKNNLLHKVICCDTGNPTRNVRPRTVQEAQDQYGEGWAKLSNDAEIRKSLLGQGRSYLEEIQIESKFFDELIKESNIVQRPFVRQAKELNEGRIEINWVE